MKNSFQILELILPFTNTKLALAKTVFFHISLLKTNTEISLTQFQI